MARDSLGAGDRGAEGPRVGRVSVHVLEVFEPGPDSFACVATQMLWWVLVGLLKQGVGGHRPKLQEGARAAYEGLSAPLGLVRLGDRRPLKCLGVATFPLTVTRECIGEIGAGPIDGLEVLARELLPGCAVRLP